MARTRFKVKEGISIADDNSVGGYQLIPVGTVVSFAGASAPDGWLMCDGTAVSRTDYVNLWTVLSTTYGPGDGSTTFNLPNAKGRSIVGAGTGSGLTARSVSDTGGTESVTLTSAQSGTTAHGHGNTISASTGTVSSDHVHNADHSHSASSDSQNASHNHALPRAFIGQAGTNRLVVSASPTDSGINVYANNATHSHGITVSSTNPSGTTPFNTGGISANHTHAVTVSGGVSTSTAANASEAHENMQPFLVLNYIIKY